MDSARRGRVLVVDDDRVIRVLFSALLDRAGYEVELASNAIEALSLIGGSAFDAIVSDVHMPEMNGLGLLRAVRQHDLDVAVALVSAEPTLDAVVTGLHAGAFRYVTKPIPHEELVALTTQAVEATRTNRLRRRLIEETGRSHRTNADRSGLAVKFESALQALWMAYQPIVRWSSREVIAHEALVRSREPALPHPGALFDAAERLHRLQSFGRTIRELAAAPMARADAGQLLFVNLHPSDLMDPTLLSEESGLGQMATRVVLEITERASLDNVSEIRSRLSALRAMGYRIALDDIGAGYAGLSSFAVLEPDVVKIDMSLIRDVHQSQTKQQIIAALVNVCRAPERLVIAEGVETADELRVLIDLGCDVFQGFLFARPGEAFPPVRWDDVLPQAE